MLRLARALIGSPERSLAVAHAAAGVRADLLDADEAILDRIIILRAREENAMANAGDRIDPAAAERLAKLPSPQREAWVLAEVYALAPREAARAMDCSVTAWTRHHEMAAGELRADAATLAAALRAMLAAIDAPASLARRLSRHARRAKALRIARLAVAMVLGALILAAGGWLVVDVLRSRAG